MKKTNFKRIIAAGLVLATAMGMSACSGKDKGGNGGDKLTWFVPVSQTPDAQLVYGEVNKLLKEKIGAELDIITIDSGAYSERMKMNMASGNDYDLCFTSDWNNKYDEAVRNGGLYDITDMLDKEFMDSLMPETFWEDAKIDGRIYAVPNVQIMTRTLAVFAKKDIVEKYGFDMESVETIEDIEPYLATVKANEPDLYPYRKLWGITPWTSGKMLEIVPGIAIMNDGSVEWFHETEDGKRGVEKFREWYKKGYIRKDVASVGDDSTDFNQGKYAFSISTWAPGSSSEESIAKTICAPVFAGCRPAMTAIGANSKNPEKAFELIKLVNTDKEIFNLIANGIEGTHYDKVEGTENTIRYKDGERYVQEKAWIFGNTFNGYVYEGQPEDIHKQVEEYNNSAFTSDVTGFYLDKTNIKTELSNMQSVSDEYTDFITVADYDKFYAEKKAKLIEAGAETVIAEIEKQVAEFLKNK